MILKSLAELFSYCIAIFLLYVLSDVTTGNACKFQSFENSSSSEFLNGDALEKCDPKGRQFAPSAVIPSLPLAVTWLRDHAKENPSLRLQVLVTGSLHLVGDIMKLLRR